MQVVGIWWCIDQRVVQGARGLLHPCLYISLSWDLMCHTSILLRQFVKNGGEEEVWLARLNVTVLHDNKAFA